MKERIYRNHWEQARRTLESARADAAGHYYDWASFKSQQAAELALKGLLRATEDYATGHSVWGLLQKLAAQAEVPEGLIECGRHLDTYYIPARYPDAYPDGAPFEYFNEKIADAALECAEAILEFVAERARHDQS